MTQSQQRGRPGARSAFGAPEPEPELTVQGGAVISLVVHAQVVPDGPSLDALHEAIRSVTRSAVLAGYADAFAQIDAAEQQPGGDHGGAPSGPAGET